MIDFALDYGGFMVLAILAAVAVGVVGVVVAEFLEAARVDALFAADMARPVGPPTEAEFIDGQKRLGVYYKPKPVFKKQRTRKPAFKRICK